MPLRIVDKDMSLLRTAMVSIHHYADFDIAYNFYYDETNNFKKFTIREFDFNNDFRRNFILGGLVSEGEPPDVNDLIKSLKLQPSSKEIKFNQIAHGDFLSCIKSKKLNLYLEYLLRSPLYIHFFNLNLLFWAVTDIIESIDLDAVLGINNGLRLKHELYEVCKSEIDSTIALFYKHNYPNIKREQSGEFFDGIIALYDLYREKKPPLLFFEKFLIAIKNKGNPRDLPFLTDNDDHIIIQDYSDYYLSRIYIFKDSQHIFDNENSIQEILSGYRILVDEEEIVNYSFVDSETEVMIQLSDVFVGLMGKFTLYSNSNTIPKIESDFDSLNEIQERNIDLLIDLIQKSQLKNFALIHEIDASIETKKYGVMIAKRGKLDGPQPYIEI